MPNIQIVTDTTSYITEDYSRTNSIDIVPLTVFFENKTFDEPRPGNFQEFYANLKTSKDFPKTSQPSTQAFIKSFEKAINDGKEVIAITISSKLSGTFNSANLAAQNVAPDKITIIDSLTSGPCLRFLVEKIVALTNSGKSREEIKEKIENDLVNEKCIFTVGTLDYLKKGGRLSNAQAFIGTLLNIKPIIALTEGILIAEDKVRGKNKAIEVIIDGIPKNASKISILHIENIQEATKLRNELEKTFTNAQFYIDELGPVLGAHLGPMAIGVSFEW